MPTYNYYNKKNKKHVSLEMKIKEMEEFEKNNPHMERNWSNGPSVRGGSISLEPDKGFKKLLTDIKRRHKGSTINNF